MMLDRKYQYRFKNNDKELILSKIELSQIDFHFKNYKKNKRVKHSNSHCDPNSKKVNRIYHI